MPDTEQNRARNPQPGTQADGVAFPLARAVVVICLATGAATQAALGAYSGKGTGELSLWRGLADVFEPGGVMPADALYCTTS